MPNDAQDASCRADPRTPREKIADALIPHRKELLRAAYILGDDEVLLRFMPAEGCFLLSGKDLGAAVLAAMATEGVPGARSPEVASV